MVAPLTIPDLTAAGALAGTEPVETVQSLVSVRTTVGAISILAKDNNTALGTSNLVMPSQNAVKTYVDNKITSAISFKGTIDCSTNPNYPAAMIGDSYVISVAGKIGGALGTTVAVGDLAVAIATNLGGTQAAVGASWDIIEHQLQGALVAANNLSDVASAATSRTNLGLGTGALLVTSTDGTLAANSDANVATQKAVKTYADAKVAAAFLGAPWTVPLIAAFTAFNQDACVFTDGPAGINFRDPGSQTFELRGAYQAAPGNTFVLYARIDQILTPPDTNARFGLVIGNSTTGKYGQWGFYTNGGQLGFIKTLWTTPTSYSSASGTWILSMMATPKWLRLTLNGTTADLAVGDGYQWCPATGLSETLASFLNTSGAIDRMGFCGQFNSPAMFNLNSFSVTAPAAGGGGIP